jgi:pimeloyl-ACP methyl ester carboxylesterase
LKSIRNILFPAVLTLGAGLHATSSAGASDTGSGADPKVTKTVVLVHGAFADGSSWNAVIPLLQAKGLKVIAVQNPLTSLADDVEFTNRAINEAKGPVVLVGHSWAGAVITEAGDNDKVKSLVYVAAFAPSVGQSVSDTVKAYPTPPGLANPVVDGAGFLKLSSESVVKYFAPDLPAAQANLIAITQGAVRGKNFDEKLTKAAWQTKPSWYIVAEKDLMIDPAAEREAAKKIKATAVSLPTSHVPMLSKPKEVADVIIAAANNIKY